MRVLLWITVSVLGARRRALTLEIEFGRLAQ